MHKWDLGENAFQIRSRFQIIWKSKRAPIVNVEQYALGRASIAKALEFGCGGGTVGLCFVVKGYDVIFTDYSEQMLKSCRNNITRIQQKDYKEKLVCQNMFNMGIKNNSVDLVFSDGVYEHIHAKQERISVLSEQRRILKKNGSLCIIIPNNMHPLVKYWGKKGYPWIDKQHCPDWEIRLSADELADELKAAGFKDISTDGCRVYDMINKWPVTAPRYLLMSLCKFLLPEWNRSFRIKYGTYIFALGQK